VASALVASMIEYLARRLEAEVWGEPQVQALRRVLEIGFRRGLESLGPELDEDTQQQLRAVLERIVSDPETAEALLDVTLKGGRAGDELKALLQHKGFWHQGLVVSPDRLVASLARELQAAASAEAKQDKSPLANLVQVSVMERVEDLATRMQRFPTAYGAQISNFIGHYLGYGRDKMPFGGRDAELQRLDDWLASDTAHPYMLLTAPAGGGKSALLVRWADHLERTVAAQVVFVPVSRRFSTSLGQVAFGALCAQLAAVHNEEAGGIALSREQLRGMAADYLSRPVDGPPLVVILDGVDEAGDWQIGPDLFPSHPPSKVRVIVSARVLAEEDEQNWLGLLGWTAGCVDSFRLDRLDREGVADIIRQQTNVPAAFRSDPQIVEEIYRLSDWGDPLLVGLYIRELGKEGVSLEQLRRRDPGLKRYLEDWWEAQKQLWEQQGEKPLQGNAGDLLSLLAMAHGPLSADDIVALAGDTGIPTGSLQLEGCLKDLDWLIARAPGRRGYVFSHPRLAEYFREKLRLAEQEDWEQRFLEFGRSILSRLNDGSLPPEDAPLYVVHYYGAHLEGAVLDSERARRDAARQAVYDLVSRGWLEVWKAVEGAYDGFLNDVDRAWRLADEEKPPNVGLQVRCALCRSSVVALGHNIPPDLLRLAVDHGVLSPLQALAFARHLQHDINRVAVIGFLLPRLQEPARTEALEAALAMVMESPPGWRLEVLQVLISGLPQDLVRLVVDRLRAVGHDVKALCALIAISRHLQSDNKVGGLTEVLHAVSSVEHQEEKAYLLAELAPQLPEDRRTTVLQQALRTSQGINDERTRAYLLAKLASYLPKKVVTEAEGIDNEWLRAGLLAALAPHLPQRVLMEAEGIDDGRSRARILGAVVPYLSEDGRARVVQRLVELARDMAEERQRVGVLSELAPHRPKEVLMEAEGIKKEWLREELLAAVAPHLPEEVLAAAKDIDDEWLRAHLLEVLAPYLPGKVLMEAEGIHHEWSRARVLTASAANLPEGRRAAVLQQALHATQGIDDEWSRARLLTKLAAHLPEGRRMEILERALHTTQGIDDELLRAAALRALAPCLPGKVLTEAEDIHHEWSRADVLTALAPHLPEAVLTAAVGIRDEWARAGVLSALAPHLPEGRRAEVLDQALKAAGAIKDESRKARVLTGLAPHLPEEVLAAAEAIKDEYGKARVLTALAPHLPEGVLVAAEDIKSEEHLAAVLIAVVPCLPKERQVDIVQRVMNALLSAGPGLLIDEDLLPNLASHLSANEPHRRTGFWRDILRKCASQPRPECLYSLEALLPLALAIGGEGTAEAILQAVLDVSEWWP